MTALLEVREKIKLFYSKSEVFLLPILKFLLAFIVLKVLNGRMGYMTRLDNTAIVLIVALMCSFLPKGFIVLFAALFSMLHMYALSLEVAVVGLVVYLLLFLLFIRMCPKESLIVVIMPLLCVMKIPYLVPVTVGLLCGPGAAVAVGCGVVAYYFLLIVTTNASTINTMGADAMLDKVRLMIDAVLDNKIMLVMAAAFAITVLVVYLIRRLPINHCWTIAMIVGAMVNLMILLVGDLMYETNVSVFSAIFGNLLALAVAKVVEFFRFCVDYNRTEKVQFEDDEYYYYVKAVPKMTVAAPTKTVKRINAQRRIVEVEEDDEEEYDYETEYESERSVVTERTQSTFFGRRSKGGKSVTIGGQDDDSETDDYEE